MRTISPIPYFKDTFNENDWSWAVSALRQDPLIWTALNNLEFLRLAIRKLGNRPRVWTPINLALLTLDENLLTEDLLETPIIIFSADLRQGIVKAFEDQTSETPPEIDLHQASFLALYLYENPEVPKPMVWSTSLACLFGLISNPIDYLSHLDPDVAVHVILSQPLSVNEQKEIFTNLLTKSNLDQRFKILRKLTTQRFEIAASVARDFLKDFPSKFEPHNKENIDQLIVTISNLITNAEIQSIVNNRSDHLQKTINAWKEAGELQISLAAQIINSEIYNGRIEKAKEFWMANRSRFKAEQIAKIIINLEQYEFTSNALNWFDDELKSKLQDDDENPDQHLALGIISYHQEMSEHAYMEACMALDCYNKTDDRNPYHLFQLSKLFLAIDKPHDSEQTIKLVLEQQPNNVDALMLLMKSYQALEEKKLAVQTAHLAVALAPNQIELRRILADSLEIDEQYGPALKEREAIIQLQESPDNTDFHNFAACALKADHPQRTASVCQKLLKENSDDSEAHRLLGDAYVSLGDPNKARSHFINATQISPTSSKSWISLAEFYEIIDQNDNKRETLHIASNAIPDAPEIQLALGKEYYKVNAYTQALRVFQNADRLVKAGNLPIALDIQSSISEHLGRTLHRLGHTEDAVITLEAAFQKDAKHIGVAHMYAQSLLAIDLPEQAFTILSEIKKRAPGNLEISLDFARACLITSNEVDEAETSLLNILKITPNANEAKALLAEAYAFNQEYNLALETYQDALNSQLQDDPSWNNRLTVGLACASLKLDQPEIAIAALKSALLVKGDDLEVLKTLSKAYHAAGQKEKSLSVATSALRLAPEDDANLDWFIQQAIALDATVKAIEALEESLKTESKKSSLLTKLGWLYLYEGDADKAWNMFSLVKTIDHIVPMDLYSASQGFLAINDPASAIECLDKAISMIDSTTDSDILKKCYFSKTTALQYLGDFEGALENIEESLVTITATPDIIEEKSKILFALDLQEEAIGNLETGIENYPQDENLKLQAITLYRATGNLGAAAKHATTILRLADNPDLSSMQPSTAAIIADLADAVLQTKFAREIVEKAVSTGSEPKSNDLVYYCLRAKLALEIDEEIAAAYAITSALKINPKHPRVLALQARLTSRQGNFDTARQTLEKALKAAGNLPNLYQSTIGTGDFVSASVIELPASTYIELADICISFQHWSVAIFLLQEAIKAASNEPRSHLAFARALVMRAEYQRLCQSLDIVKNAPGQSAIAEFAYQQFEKSILRAAHLITETTPTADTTSSRNVEPKSMIATWLARGQAIFRPSSEHAHAIEKLSRTPENQAAYIAALRYCRDFTKAIKISHQNYKEIGQQVSHPLLSGQVALTLIKESPEKAAEVVQTAIKVSNWLNIPHRPIYYAIQAEIAKCNDDPELHLQAIRSALDLWPKEPNWLVTTANLLLDKSTDDDISVAIQYLEQAALLEPKQVSHHIKLANAHNRSNSPQDALRVLEQATHVITRQPEPWLALAGAYQLNGDIPQAIRCAKMVVQLDPTVIDAYLILAEIALEVENPQKAFKYIDDILDKEPENTQALMLRSRAYQALNKPEEALKYLDKAIPNLPKSIPIQLERVRLIHQAQGEDSALEALKSLNNDYPENPYILGALAEALSINGDQNAAIQTAQDALRNGRKEMEKSGFINLLQLLGRLLRKSGQLDQAIHNLSEAVEISPSIPGPYIDLGRCYQEQRQYERALLNFQNAITIAPDDPQPYYFAGLILKETKDFEDAEEMFKKAANLAPMDLNIHRQLGAVTAINLVHSCQAHRSLTPIIGRMEP